MDITKLLKQDENIMAYVVKKQYFSYLILLLVISIFEVIMLGIRLGVIIYNKAINYFDIGYLICYVLLLVFSLVSLIYLWVKRNERNKPANEASFVRLLRTYCCFITFWSVGISSLDLAPGNLFQLEDPIVYLTIIVCIASFSYFQPISFTINLLVSLGCLYGITYGILKTPFNSSVFANTIIFLALAILINTRSYRFAVKELKTTAELSDLSYTDQLTHIQNRRAFDLKVQKVIGDNVPFTFIITDIDGFKKINDDLGHETGDEILKGVSSILKEAFGEENCFRYGGDEFCILYSNVESRDTLIHNCNKVNHCLKDRYADIGIALSFGVYDRIRDEDFDVAFNKADKAVYTAKKSKGTSLAFYKPEIKQNNKD